MSYYLVERIKAQPNIEVLTRSEVTALEGCGGNLETARWRAPSVAYAFQSSGNDAFSRARLFEVGAEELVFLGAGFDRGVHASLPVPLGTFMLHASKGAHMSNERGGWCSALEASVPQSRAG